MRDDCITVAVEDMPDEGLDQPLRLDKLANEVTYQSSMNVFFITHQTLQSLSMLKQDTPCGYASRCP